MNPNISKLANNLEVVATVSKLVQDPLAVSRRRYNEQYGPGTQTLKDITDRTNSRIRDGKNFLQLLPDLKMAVEILVSSVLSPKDMMEINVGYTSESDMLPTDVLATLNSICTDYFSRDYKITPLLPEILKDILAGTGSYAIATLPENAIDDVINGNRVVAAEEYNSFQTSNFSNLGILGPSKLNEEVVKASKRYSFETYYQSNIPTEEQSRIVLNNLITNIVVTDNPNVFRRNKLDSALKRQRQSELVGYGSALESYTGIDLWSSSDSSPSKLYKEARRGYKPLVQFKTQDQLARRSASSGLRLHLPSGSLVPVTEPGDPTKHLGYFCILDERGNPINPTNVDDYYQQLKNSLCSDLSSSLVQRMSNQFEGVDYTERRHIDELTNAFVDMIEADWNARLRNGLVEGEVKIANKEAIWRIMLARTLEQQYTQVIYLPRELVTYMAVEYDEYGIGKSLLDDLRVICSLRVVTMFANMMASIKNSIGRTGVNVKFDEHDADPWKTLEIVMGELNRSRAGMAGFLPVGASGPAEVVEWLTNAGYEFTFEGHPAMPDIKIDFDEKNTNYTKVDTDLEDDLRKRSLLGLAVPPEVIDNALSPEFATIHANNHILFSKRVLQIQEQFTPQLAEHAKKAIINDTKLMRNLRTVILDNAEAVIKRLVNKEEITAITSKTQITEELKTKITNTVLTDYVNNFTVTLPKPNSAEIDNQLESYETYKKALEECLNHFFDSSFANSDTMGELGDRVDLIKDAVFHMYMRQWIVEHNMLPELYELVTEDENGKISRDVYEDISDHIHKLTKAIARLSKSLIPNIEAGNKWAEAHELEETSDNSSDDDDSSDESDTDDSASDDSDSDEFSMDDIGMDEPEDTEETEDSEASEPNEE